MDHSQLVVIQQPDGSYRVRGKCKGPNGKVLNKPVNRLWPTKADADAFHQVRRLGGRFPLSTLRSQNVISSCQKTLDRNNKSKTKLYASRVAKSKSEPSP